MNLLALVSASLLGLIWIAYPIAIGAIGRISRRAVGKDVLQDLPTVCVVIATREAPGPVRERVANCFEAYDPALLEVIVAVDAGVGDLELEPYRGDRKNVRVIRGDAPGGKVCALNAAVRASTAEILVFTDTYQRFAPDTIRSLIAHLHSPLIGAVSGRLELRGERGSISLAGWYWTLERWLRKHEAGVHSTVGVTGAVYAMRRALWSPLPAGLLLDDLYVPMRLVLSGYRIHFASEAQAFETRSHDSSQEYRRKVRTLTGVLQLCVWLPNVLHPGRNPIWLQFVFHKLLRLLTPYLMAAVTVAGTVLSVQWMRYLESSYLMMIGLVLCVVAASRPRLVGAALSGVRQIMLLQAAILVATFNGVRGRWDVWT